MPARHPIRLAAPIAAAAALAACAGLPQPFSQLDGHRYHLTPIDTYAVQIVAVDDHYTTDSPAFVEPGLRKVRVQGPPDATHRVGEQRVIDLNIAPCTRYYLVAVKANRLTPDFGVKVDHEESIGGCATTTASK